MFDFVFNISDERVCIRVTSQAEGMRFLMKVRMAKFLNMDVRLTVLRNMNIDRTSQQEDGRNK